MNIREARKKDAGILSKIAVEAVMPHKSIDFTDDGWKTFLSATTPEATRRRLEDIRYSCFCAENGEDIEGFLTIKDGEKLDQLFVRPSAQRAGVATRLWEHAKAAFSSAGQSTDFWVRSSTIAIPLYRRLGFVECGGRVTENGITHQLMKMAGATRS